MDKYLYNLALLQELIPGHHVVKSAERRPQLVRHHRAGWRKQRFESEVVEEFPLLLSSQLLECDFLRRRNLRASDRTETFKSDDLGWTGVLGVCDAQ